MNLDERCIYRKTMKPRTTIKENASNEINDFYLTSKQIEYAIIAYNKYLKNKEIQTLNDTIVKKLIMKKY